MNNISLALSLAAILLVYGCANNGVISFNEGMKKLNQFDEMYNATVKSPPPTQDQTTQLIGQLVGFKAGNRLSNPLSRLIDFRITFLEAEKLNAEGWQWGKASTTKYGFGCKGYERIRESAKLRNASAQKGFEAVGLLEKFVEEFPKESKSLNFTKKDALALNAMYFQEEEKAQKDARVIENFCNKNETKEVAS